MKYILSIFGVGIICLAVFLFGGKPTENKMEDSVRIHVVANSNSNFDEDVKYFVKDVVVEFLQQKFSNFQTAGEVKDYLNNNFLKIENIVNSALLSKGAKYQAKISLEKESMPARVYGENVFEEGVYDSLKIELGKAQGDNWWCVVFPSVCFLSSKKFESYEYKSKIWDILNSVI